MAKRNSRRRAGAPAADAEIPVVPSKHPCPCGSGKKYKACHGKQAAMAERRLVARPFEGLAGEGDWIAMREFVPAAVAPLTFNGDWADRVGDRQVSLVTVLPTAWPGLVRSNGDILVAAQTVGGSGDISRDFADVIERAVDSEAGPLLNESLPSTGTRLQDMLDPSAPLRVDVQDNFEFWLDEGAADTAEIRQAMERVNASIVASQRLTMVDAAYWASMNKEHLRWVMLQDEDPLLDAFAKLHVAGADSLGPDTRFIGSFRAHGRLVPVWDLAPGTSAEQTEEPAAAFGDRLAETLADDRPLTPEERSAKAGLKNRQLTLR